MISELALLLLLLVLLLLSELKLPLLLELASLLANQLLLLVSDEVSTPASVRPLPLLLLLEPSRTIADCGSEPEPVGP